MAPSSPFQFQFTASTPKKEATSTEENEAGAKNESPPSLFGQSPLAKLEVPRSKLIQEFEAACEDLGINFTELLRTYFPKLKSQASELMSKYKGKELELFHSLAKKNNISNPINSAIAKVAGTIDFRKLLTDFVTTFDAKELPEVDRRVKKYSGQECRFFLSLAVKYSTSNPYTDELKAIAMRRNAANSTGDVSFGGSTTTVTPISKGAEKTGSFSFGGATSTSAAPISNVPAECPAEMQVGENQHFTNALSSTKVSTIVEVGRASDAGSKKSERVVERVVLGPKVLHPQSVPKAAPLKVSPLVVATAPVPVTGIVEGVNLLLNSDGSSLAGWQLHVYAHLKSEPANVSASGLESQLILVRSVTLKTMKLKSSNGRCTFVPLSEPISVERGHFLGVCNSNSSSALRVAASTKVASTNEEQEGDRLPAGKGGVLDFNYGGSTSFPAGEGGTVVVTPLVGCQLALNFVFRPICEGKGAEGTSTSTDYGLASNFETG
jgi:hypothetical protein